MAENEIKFVPYAYDEITWPDGPQGRAIVRRWTAEPECPDPFHTDDYCGRCNCGW